MMSVAAKGPAARFGDRSRRHLTLQQSRTQIPKFARSLGHARKEFDNGLGGNDDAGSA